MTDAVTSGSGFVIDPAGYILTAGHVAMAPGWRVEARGPDGRSYKGRVVKLLKNNDLALIKLERTSGLRPVMPSDSPCLKVGEGIFSLGKPRKSGDTARLGEVASMSFGRAVTYDDFGYPDAMVLKLETRKGESGGPVFNTNGDLTGMLVSTLSDSSGRHLNLAHAVPTPDLARFVCERHQLLGQVARADDPQHQELPGNARDAAGLIISNCRLALSQGPLPQGISTVAPVVRRDSRSSCALRTSVSG